MPTFEFEEELKVSAGRLWAALEDFNKLVPVIYPSYISSVDHIAGTEGQAGAVRLIKFGPALPKDSYVKEKVLSIYPATWTINTAEIEGGHLTQGFRKWWPTMTLIPKGDRVTSRWTVSYEGGEDGADVIMDQTKDDILRLYKKLEEHLLTSGENYDE
ncbi:hypothetical protein R1sor_026820 [Riccia sorocarpa]|uniref:Bet v I/Major latex protein domain-containing protein n=1 Tax=Riccia sorocarpa TaxID=122646 RepID=A0ABD3GE78_9MARC